MGQRSDEVLLTASAAISRKQQGRIRSFRTMTGRRNTHVCRKTESQIRLGGFLV